MGGSIARTDIAALCRRLRQLLEHTHADLVVCDIGALDDHDAVAVDALARMQLTARRLGRQLWLRHACGELEDLLGLVGLLDVVPCAPESALEPRGQAEEREPARGVQEEGDPADPVA